MDAVIQKLLLNGDPTVMFAAIAGGSSLVLLVANFALIAKNNKKLAKIKADHEDELSALRARRSYEYEARKKLFHEFEPLVFQLMEAAEKAFERVRHLAGSARNGQLSRPETFAPGGYYARSTIYDLFAPMAIFRLMNRKLPLVNLKVDRSMATMYKLAKNVYNTFVDDYGFAACEPRLEYNGDHPDSNLAKYSPGIYRKQAFPLGTLDKTLDAFIERYNDMERIISFGEFEKKLETGNTDLVAAFELFEGFHPGERPVLWRMLMTQAVIYHIMIRMRTDDFTAINNERVKGILHEDIFRSYVDDFDWGNDGRKVTYTFYEPYNAALNYFDKHFSVSGMD